MAKATTAVTPTRWPISRIAAALVFCATLLAGTGPTMAAEPVDMELVIAVDVSSSVDENEYRLQMEGIAAAFRDPSVLDAIRALGPIGLAALVMQWSDNREQVPVAGWHVIWRAADAAAYAHELQEAPRAIPGGQTSIAGATEFAIGELANNGFNSTRQAIIVSADGRSINGIHPKALRDQATRQGITINGLAILNEEPFLDDHFRQSVIGGRGAFLAVMDDYRNFAAAMQQTVVHAINAAKGKTLAAVRHAGPRRGKKNLFPEHPPLPPGRQVQAALPLPACPSHRNLQLVEVTGSEVWHPNQLPEQVEPLAGTRIGAFRSRIWMDIHPVGIPTQCRGRTCRLCPEPLRVDLWIEPIAIVYDPSVSVGSCRYLKVRAHERTHATIAKRVESHHRARLQRKLTDLVRDAREHTIAAEEVPHARQGLRRQIAAAAQQARAAMHTGNRRAQDLIHTTAYRTAERSAVRNCLVTLRYQAPPFPHLDPQTIGGTPRSSQGTQGPSTTSMAPVRSAFPIHGNPTR